MTRTRTRTPRPAFDQEETMSNIAETLDTLLKTDGATSAAIVDSSSGMLLGQAGSGLDLEVAAAGNTEVVRAKLKTIAALGLDDTIDDILITLTTQYHVIRPLAATPEVFIYLVLDSAKSNLALARINVKKADATLEL
jgi:predicted regulator of Ras-like GTPase activity (Roadblock/LC7/MglB family)